MLNSFVCTINSIKESACNADCDYFLNFSIVQLAKNLLYLLCYIIILFILPSCAQISNYKAHGKIAQINFEINQVKYVSDKENYGVDDYIATPKEFYKNGGDCEDYVNAKIEALEKAGFKRENMSYVLMLLKTGEFHLALALKKNQTTYILDNESNKIQSIAYLKKIDPNYYIGSVLKKGTKWAANF